METILESSRQLKKQLLDENTELESGMPHHYYTYRDGKCYETFMIPE